MLRTILTILFIIDSLGICVTVLMQKGRDSGLGAIAGSSDTYWDKNKSHSFEGRVILITRIMIVVFFALALLLNMKVI